LIVIQKKHKIVFISEEDKGFVIDLI